jgi:phosphatidylserine/phosphatidylglycerophosphate/cardiolipin synthase-like enzyme
MLKYAIFLIVLSLTIVPAAYSQVVGYPDFEIVETVPVETNLGYGTARNPHDVWLQMINGAKQSLDIEEFYVSNKKGEPLEDIIAAVIEAGKRGVKVRLSVDWRMYKTYPETVDSLGKCSNITARVLDYHTLTGGIEHAKFFIVDGKEAYMGSQNFDWRSLKHIHELGVRLSQLEAVKAYEDVFNLDWNLSEKNDKSLISTFLSHHTYNTPITEVEGPGDTLTYVPTMSPKILIADTTLWDETNVVKMIDAASSNVMIQALTYSTEVYGGGTYTVIDSALRRAAARGVKVKLITSDWSIGNGIIDCLKSLASVPNIEVKYTSIPKYSGGYASFARVEHLKYVIADANKSWIGTANWEKGYFYQTRNLGVAVTNAKINAIMQKIFWNSWNSTYANAITPTGTYEARKHGEIEGQ